MKKRLLLSALAIASLAIGSNQGAFATTQDISATLATNQSITVKAGQTVSTTMSVTDGSLAAALNPAFTVITNTPSTLNWQADVDTSDSGQVNALSDQGGTYYVALANTVSTRKPTAAAVTNALGASPAILSNFNVVAYALTGVPTSSGTGIGTFTYSATGGNHFEADIDAACASEDVTATTVTAARALTYCPGDTSGSYQAVITLTFVS